MPKNFPLGYFSTYHVIWNVFLYFYNWENAVQGSVSEVEKGTVTCIKTQLYSPEIYPSEFSKKENLSNGLTTSK